ncbi:hypothetical protein CAPTEDRAFT_193818, partial [Capitella teleta]
CHKPGCSYASCAQILDVKLRYAVDKLTLPNRQEEFFGFHQEFVHPKYVLRNEVSFYCADNKYATFVEAPAGIQVWQSQHGSFHKPAQFHTAIRYIRMPTWAFNKLADDIGEPPAKVIIIEFLPRSGSTLLCQMFESTGKCVVFSEPSCLSGVEQKGQDLVRYYRSCLRLMCKAVDDMNVHAYVFKMAPWKAEYRIDIVEAMPNIKFLFLYRDILKCSASLASISNAVTSFKMIFLLESIFGKPFRRMLFKWFQKNATVDVSDAVMQIYLMTSNIRLFQAFLLESVVLKVCYGICEKDNNTPSVKYEHILANPSSCLSTIFAFCGLSQDFVEPALRALKKDSQANSLIGKDQINKNKPFLQVDAQLEDEMARTAKAMNIPLLTNGKVMFNTITR